MTSLLYGRSCRARGQFSSSPNATAFCFTPWIPNPSTWRRHFFHFSVGIFSSEEREFFVSYETNIHSSPSCRWLNTDNHHAVFCCSWEETQTVTPTNMREAPNAVRSGCLIGSPNSELVTKENKRAMALQMGTAKLMSDFANRI